MKILIIEDQVRMAHFIRKGLEEEGYIVDIVHNGQEGVDYALTSFYNLILLDILLPQKNGFQVCQEIRQKKIQAPILMLTAKDVLEDKVKGLDAGADDYLTKPFSFVELVARVRALLRRGIHTKNHLLEVENLKLDLLKHQVERNNARIELTTKEFSLLEYFMRSPSIVLSRTMIAENVWGFDFDSETNIVDVYINRLRNKINLKNEPPFIHTIRGRGYVFKK